MGTARAQTLVWDGSLEIGDGSVLAVEPVGFQSPLDGVQMEGTRRVTWRSSTAGNAAGFRLRVEGDAGTRLRFASEPAAFDFGLDEVRLAALTVDAGPPNRRVTVAAAPREDGPMQVELSWRDVGLDRVEADVDHNEQARGSVYPYWVRVLQVDQARAWSSPVYVTHRSD
jgi:hypothetical protein